MQQSKGKEKALAEQRDLPLATGSSSCSQPGLSPPMTKHTGFRRACSLRVPKAPGLLDRVPGRLYDSLEEALLPWEAKEAPWRAGGTLSHSQEAASQQAARRKGRCIRRALSLKGQDMKDEEATLAGEASDGQLLIGQPHGKAQASNRVKRCQKVNLTLQRGWQSFLANVHRLTAMRSVSLPTR